MVVTVLGGGGKMGCRIIDRLAKTPGYTILAVEIAEAGMARLAERGVVPTAEDRALAEGDAVIFALPDRVIGKVARQVIPKMKPGAMTVCLDPAAPHAGELPLREDIAYFVTHPCHPPVLNNFETKEEREDYFGAIAAPQPIVCALQQGTDDDYAQGETLARAIFAPVTRSHRVTVEQMAILEPAMSETVTACAMTIIYEAMEEAIARGVPAEAAYDFMMGHIHAPLGILFANRGGIFSDGAKLIIEHGRHLLIQEGWRERIFSPESVKAQVEAIVKGTPPGP